MLTDKRLQEIKKISKYVVDQTWNIYTDIQNTGKSTFRIYNVIPRYRTETVCRTATVSEFATDRALDAFTFIANAPQMVGDLLAEVDRLQKEIVLKDEQTTKKDLDN